MNSCKNFSKNHPALLAALSFFFVWGLLKLTRLVPDGPFSFAISEGIMAIIVFIATILFMGREKVRFSIKGIGYAFHSLRGYYFFMIFVTALTIVETILNNVVLEGTDISFQPVTFINILIGCICVGIVEEFSFRGFMFGGLLQKFGNAKKGIIFAAVISGLLFGFAHVMDSVISGEIINMAMAITAILKTLQCAIFGIVLSFIYYKTRNLYLIAALHALDDFMLMLFTTMGNSERISYVGTDNMGIRVGAYVVFIVVLVPSLVRCIKNVRLEDAKPFDDDFLPRKVELKKEI